MSLRKVFAYDENGKKILDENGIPTHTYEERKRITTGNFIVKTDKKTDKVFHHEAGKGSRRR